MASSKSFHQFIEGTMFLVSCDGCVSSFAFSCERRSFALSECRKWLLQRPDLCFVSVVCGSIVVAMAGEFPFRLSDVSLAPLGC